MSSAKAAKAPATIPNSFSKIVKVTLAISLVSPLAWIAWKFLSVPSANPAQELNHLFGRVGYYALALNMNIGSLLALFRILKRPWPRPLLPVLTYRQHLGIAGVLFLVVHIAFHFLIEGGIAEGFVAITQAVYLIVGLTAFLGLAVLAITSNHASKKRLKAKWKTLHRAVYPLFFLATAHTLMIEKADLQHFGLVAAITALPLLARLLWHLLVRRAARDAVP